MKNIITVQHTQSVHHTNGMVGSWTDWELTETGKQQACANDLMDAMMDKFGKDVTTYAYDMENFRVEVDVVPGTVFYSWVFGFGGKVVIKGPANVKEEYRQMVLKAAEGVNP